MLPFLGLQALHTVTHGRVSAQQPLQKAASDKSKVTPHLACPFVPQVSRLIPQHVESQRVQTEQQGIRLIEVTSKKVFWKKKIFFKHE